MSSESSTDVVSNNKSGESAKLGATVTTPPASGNGELINVETPTVPITDLSKIEKALESGDVSHVSSRSALEAAILQKIDKTTHLLDDAIASIFNLDSDGSKKSDGSSLTSLTWNPTHDAAILQSTFGENRPLLLTNSVFVESYEIRSTSIGIIGGGTSPYILLGSNPMRNHYRNAESVNHQTHQFLENSIQWLIGKNDVHSDIDEPVNHSVYLLVSYVRSKLLLKHDHKVI